MSTRQNYVPPGQGIVAGSLLVRANEADLLDRWTVPGARPNAEPRHEWSFRPAAAHGTAGEGEARPACEGFDGDLFFAEGRGAREAAKALCRACPRRAECLEDALAADARHGVFGGLDDRERREISRRRSRGPELGLLGDG